MSESRLLPSMFHRRVALLLALCALSFAVLAAQMGRLTLVHGAELRAEADKRLQRTDWMPTSRGRILDRKGRVLAQDRPSLEVRVGYSVLISGLPEPEIVEGAPPRHTWVRAEALRMARTLHRSEWRELDATQRADLADHYEPILLRHVEQMWPEIAALTGSTVEQIERRRMEIRGRVESMRSHLKEINLKRLREEAEERGRALTDDLSSRLERQADQDIREQRIAHTVVSYLSDADGFRLEGRAHETAMLRVTPVGSRSPREYEVPALPGLEVAGSRERAHPFDRVVVDLDVRTLPAPLRAEVSGGEAGGIEPGGGVISREVVGAMTHVVGWMREGVTGDDEQRRAEWLQTLPARRLDEVAPRGADRGRYFSADNVGDRGVERAQEHRLRGLRGLRVRQLDTGETYVAPPAPGEDVELTIDAMLQARILAAMDPEVGLAKVLPWHERDEAEIPLGTKLNGAAVVIDIHSGDVLAMVSTPTFSHEALASNRTAIFGDTLNLPYMNRAAGVAYPPGSIAKAILLTAAVTKGVHDLHTPIACNGHYLPDRDDMLRCWIYRDRYYFSTHSQRLQRDLSAVDALRVSCNIYFYTIGSELGRRGIIEAYRMFGAGESLPLGVGLESAGVVGPLGSLQWTYDDAIMGIGQGKVVWTPVHAADAFATLARGGVRIPPRVVRDGSPREPVDLGLDPASVAAAMQGLWEGANLPEGTGHHITIAEGQEPIFNAPGVEVWAKTGTAQSAPRDGDPDGDGPLPVQRLDGDHAWVVGLVGPERGGPKYAFAVLMEYAGSGGRVSGPIANQVVHALIAEGYLGQMADGQMADGRSGGGAEEEERGSDEADGDRIGEAHLPFAHLPFAISRERPHA